LVGFVLVISAFLVNLTPTFIAGQSISGTLDAGAILAFYNHPLFAGIYVYWSLTSFYLIILALALRYALKEAASTSVRELLLTPAIALVIVEAALVIVQSAVQSTLVTLAGTYAASGSGAARAGLEAVALSLFRFWDIMYNSLLYWVEAGWLLLFSIVKLKGRTFAHWIGWVGGVAAILQVVSALAIPLSFPAGLTFPGNIALALWFIAVSVSLIRLKT